MNASPHCFALRRLRRLSRIFASALLCASLAAALAQQPPNLNYTDSYPSVERVKAEIKGSDPTDTIARQIGVLAYLSAEIKRIKYTRSIRGEYTPGELRLITAYDLAAYQMLQDYQKTHTPAQFQDFDRLQFNYTIDREFRKDWTKRLIGAQGQAAYSGAQSELSASSKRH